MQRQEAHVDRQGARLGPSSVQRRTRPLDGKPPLMLGALDKNASILYPHLKIEKMPKP
jgi:hypothetical protein